MAGEQVYFVSNASLSILYFSDLFWTSPSFFSFFENTNFERREGSLVRFILLSAAFSPLFFGLGSAP